MKVIKRELVDVDTNLIVIALVIAVPVAGALIALGVKIVRLEERVNLLTNNPPNLLNQFTREQFIEFADTLQTECL